MVFGHTYAERPRRIWHEWHKMFAIVPQRLTDGRWVWLQWCERKMILGGDGACEYRLDVAERGE